MPQDIPSIISHVSIGTNRFEAAVRFYDQVLATIGARRLVEHPGAIGYGKVYPEFWVGAPHEHGRAQTANGVHFGFIAANKEAVDAFHRTALANGGVDDGAPGPRPLYGAPYYGCFVRDLDGHKIEAAFWDEALA